MAERIPIVHEAKPRPARERAERAAPIVPKSSVAGRALVAIVAIMTFLAGLTIGAVDLVRTSAASWQTDVASEMTIEVRPVSGRDIEAEIGKAVEIARATPGIAEVRPYSKEEIGRLLEPWLGGSDALDALPVPRLIVLKLGEGAPDFAALKRRLSEEVAGASLDDHGLWSERLASMAEAMIWTGIGVLALVLTATALAVIFATQAAMSGSRDIIEVLNMVGARNRFIARQFERRFLVLGFQGAAIGGVAASLALLIAATIAERGVATASGDQLEALFGRFQVAASGYLGLLAVVLAIAVITAVTARVACLSFLARQDRHQE